MTKKEILAYRQEKFQKLIREKDLGAILFVICSRDGFELYFSGNAAKTYPPYDAPLQSMDTCVLLKKDDKPTLIHASYLTEPGAPDPLLTHFGVGNEDMGDFRWVVNQKAELYIDALAENKRLGIVNPHDLRDELYEFICKYAPGVEFVDVTKEANILKAEKCEGDLEKEKESALAVDRLFARMHAIIHPEVLEHDAVNAIRKAGARIGYIGNNYSDWINIDLTSSPDGEDAQIGPVNYPGRRFKFGDRVNVNMIAAIKDDYPAACGRCFTIGTPSCEAKKYWDLAVKAQEAAVSALKPGATIAQAVKKAVDEVYVPNGIDYTPSNWIFGLGLNFAMAELPMAIPEWEDMPLKEGMILAVAPKIEPMGKDPYCCMDTFVITENGCERLTKTAQDIHVLMDV